MDKIKYEVEKQKKLKENGICRVGGCGKKLFTKNFCKAHADIANQRQREKRLAAMGKEYTPPRKHKRRKRA